MKLDEIEEADDIAGEIFVGFGGDKDILYEKNQNGIGLKVLKKKSDKDGGASIEKKGKSSGSRGTNSRKKVKGNASRDMVGVENKSRFLNSSKKKIKIKENVKK